MKLDNVKRQVQHCENEMNMMLINANGIEKARIKASARYRELYGDWKYYKGVADAKEERI